MDRWFVLILVRSVSLNCLCAVEWDTFSLEASLELLRAIKGGITSVFLQIGCILTYEAFEQASLLHTGWSVCSPLHMDVSSPGVLQG